MELETQMKKFNLITLLIYFVIILLNLLQNTYATNNSKYSIPSIIAETELTTVADVEFILTSEKLKIDLQSFAKNLTEEEIAQQSMFNRIALLSLRGELAPISSSIKQQGDTLEFSHYEMFHQIRIALNSKKISEKQLALEASDLIQRKFEKLNDEEFVQMSLALGWSVSGAKDYVFNVYKQLQNESQLSQENMINVAVNTHLFHVLDSIIPITSKIIKQEQQRRFVIQPNVLVKLKNGIELATTIVRSRGQIKANSTALQFTIYADEASHIKTAILSIQITYLFF